MPRIPPVVFWRARRVDPAATLLLPVCRDLPSSLTEFRWIQQHVDQDSSSRQSRRAAVLALCRRRGRGEPLQYVLGTQPFGPLDLICRPGVLIPRPEPEAYGLFLADLLQKEGRLADQPPLRILDLCTGTGCIALLLYAQLRQPLHIIGIDVSPVAVSLARTNRDRHGFHHSSPERSICFSRADIFADDWLYNYDCPLDVLVCNPPYISADGFAHDTARSVRVYEPKLAQVPQVQVSPERNTRPEDVFYSRLLTLAARLDTRIMLCEVGGLDQARRVVEMALLANTGPPVDVEIWADCPDIPDPDGRRIVQVAGRDVLVRGSGHGRSVFIRRK